MGTKGMMRGAVVMKATTRGTGVVRGVKTVVRTGVTTGWHTGGGGYKGAAGSKDAPRQPPTTKEG